MKQLTKEILKNSKWRVTPEQSKILMETAIKLKAHPKILNNVPVKAQIIWFGSEDYYSTIYYKEGATEEEILQEFNADNILIHYTERKFEDYFDDYDEDVDMSVVEPLYLEEPGESINEEDREKLINIIESTKKYPTTNVERPIGAQLSDYPRNKELWNEKEENAMNGFGYEFKERNTNNEIIFKKLVKKENKFGDFEVSDNGMIWLNTQFKDDNDKIHKFATNLTCKSRKDDLDKAIKLARELNRKL